ncbi:hypothetical protein DUI87_20231 [Hirundo rustica rustica]|uniref:Carbohydrate sulfotransferase n=1 Tax=Hirundo rustica rustica TaxID=333673 RepID=A0A3M0JPT0_HIRRU|nr:hypothetical protein DUI87_20231 [Hirundo rustica rustica]
MLAFGEEVSVANKESRLMHVLFCFPEKPVVESLVLVYGKETLYKTYTFILLALNPMHGMSPDTKQFLLGKFGIIQEKLSNTAILHQIRRDQVTDTCRANSVSSRKRRVLTPNDLKHLVVDEDHEMIYCYVPKVACTNWKRVMMVLTGRGKYSDPMEIPANEAHVSSNLKTLNQYSIAEINHRLKNYMKFLFVREPFERLVSAYRNKFTQKYNTSFHKRYGTKIVRRQRKNATQEALRKGDDVKFEEFVAYLIDPHTQREEPFNEHWQTVYSLCHPCHIHYDLIGKYETLEEDSNYVLQLAGVGNYLKFPTYAKSTRTTDEMTTEFFQNISSLHQMQLYEVYKLDFLMFNYSVPSYLKLE